jgi:hypothetical protein
MRWRAIWGSARITPREAAHVAALTAWVEGDFAGATARWEAIAADHPRDILALKLGQCGRFYSGECERMRDVLAAALSAWDEGVPGYGFVLGCHAFGLEETGDYRAAERTGREAVERNPADIWAAHAVAHVFEMTGRSREGVGGPARARAISLVHRNRVSRAWRTTFPTVLSNRKRSRLGLAVCNSSGRPTRL